MFTVKIGGRTIQAAHLSFQSDFAITEVLLHAHASNTSQQLGKNTHARRAQLKSRDEFDHDMLLCANSRKRCVHDPARKLTRSGKTSIVQPLAPAQARQQADQGEGQQHAEMPEVHC